jgi:hypothetical protein
VPLSDDQKAMLRLLAQREEGYADIAALKGMSVEEVRADVKAALEELAAEPRPAAAEPPTPTPPPVEPPAPPDDAPPPRAGRKPSRPSRPLPAIPPERRRMLALAGGAVGIVAVALIAFAVFGDNSSSSNPAGGGAGPETASAGGAQLTQATLTPPGGGEASGRAIFGRVGQEEVALQVTAEGLEPSRQGTSYTVWLYRSPQLALRVGSVKVPANGRLGARFPIPAELLAYVASGAFKQISVSRTVDAAYSAAVRRARKKKTLPPFSGETVLRGKITGPIVKQQ